MEKFPELPKNSLQALVLSLLSAPTSQPWAVDTNIRKLGVPSLLPVPQGLAPGPDRGGHHLCCSELCQVQQVNAEGLQRWEEQ